MPFVEVNDFRINYEITCPGKGPTLLLVQGFGEQIGSVTYPEEQCRIFASHGFQVVRMENRDSGLSLPIVSEDKIKPYSFHHLADDVAAVIEALAGGPIHLVGASLGGFIVRWTAIRHPEKIKSLTVVMSGSGAGPGEDGPQLPGEAARRLSGFLQRRPRDEQLSWNLEIWRWFWGNGYPFPSDWLKERLASSFDRSFRPEANARLLKATVKTLGLWEAQSNISCPTLVMHGGEDPFFPVEHGKATLKRIPAAEFWLDPLMGHMMHPEQWEEMALRLAGLAGIKSG